MKTNRLQVFCSLFHRVAHFFRRLTDGRVSGLHGARADVLSMRDVSTYDASGHLEPCYLLDALIEPATPETAWEPGGLALLPFAAGVVPGFPNADLCRVLSAEVLESRRFQPAAHRVCVGTRRVRLSLRVCPGLARLSFRHGSAVFGNVALPESALVAA